jgi:LuxR family maltose regulon positive regulatory protein
MPVDDLQILRGQILALRAQKAFFCNQTMQAIDLCRQALALLPLSWAFVRGGSMLFLGMSMAASGQAPAAERLLLEEYESCDAKTEVYGLLLLRTLGVIYLNTGQLEQARQITQVLLKGSTLGRVAIQKNWGDWLLGLVHYHRNELEAAEQHFSQIVENRYTAQIATYRDAIAGLALIHQIQGKSLEAKQMVESISQFDLEQRGSEDNRTLSLRARLLFLQGDLDGAVTWIDPTTDLPSDQPFLWLEEPQVTRVRILIARGAESDLQLARQILDSLLEITERTHNTRYKIEILALRAIMLEAQGESIQSLIELKQAVDLARPGEFIRVFVDLGKPMQKMLGLLIKQGHSVETVQRILMGFPADDHHSIQRENPAQPARRPILDDTTPIEPLTNRELEVLACLRGLSGIKEVALQLNISYATVRRHTINIYGKLGVNRRWDAVAKAEELQILPPR